MAKSELVIIINAKDHASGTIKKLQGSLGGLTKTFQVGLVAGTAAGAAGLAAFGVGLGKLISIGSDTQEMMSKFRVVFGQFSAGAIKDFDALAAATGRSTFELRAMASSVQDTFVPLGFARGEATKMSEKLVQLAVDVGSFNNVADVDVMRDFQSAIVGNTETVRKYGIVINQAALEQSLLDMGIAKGVAGATEREKAQARLNLIIAGSSDAIGDAVRTGDQWANQMRALKAVIGDTAKKIGLGLVPVFTPLLQQITTLARDTGPGLVAWAHKAIGAIDFFSFAVRDGLGPIEAFRAVLARYVGMDAASRFEGLANMAEAAANALAELPKKMLPLQEALRGLLEKFTVFVSFQDVLVAVGAILAAIVVPALLGIVMAVAPVVAAFAGLVLATALVRTAWEKDWGGIREKAAAVTSWLQERVPRAVQIIREKVEQALAAIRAFWSEHGKQVEAEVQEMWDAITSLAGVEWKWLQDRAGDALKGIRAFWSEHGKQVEAIVRTLADIVGDIMDGLMKTVSGILHIGADIFKGDWRKLGKDLRSIVEDIALTIQKTFNDVDWVGLGKAILQGIITGVKSLGSVLEDAVRSILSGLWDAVQGFVGAHSPSERYKTLGQNMMAGLAEGIIGGADMAQRAMVQALENMSTQALFGPTVLSLAPVPVGGGTAFAPVPAIPPLHAGSQGVAGDSVTVQFGDVYMRNDMDIEELAYRVVQEIQRRAR